MANKIKFNTYFKAGILTLLIFLSGILFGIWIDNYRLSSIRERLSTVEINSNDAILLATFFEKLGKNYCDIALDSNLKFNNKIYREGIEIEKSIEVNSFTPELEQELRRYVILQTQFWFNSIELKETCDFDYKNVVHLFKQKDLTREEMAENKVQSRVMIELKEKCGNKIMLIPLTTDLDLSVVDAIENTYNITKLPAVIIDEEVVFQGLTNLDKLQEITKC